VAIRRACAVAVLAIGWLWPAAVAVDLCLHLASDHGDAVQVENAAAVVVHGHAHAHGVAAHGHDATLTASRQGARPPGTHGVALAGGGGVAAGQPTALLRLAAASPPRGSPPPLHLLHCAFLS
jgi:hypothetical protein